MINTNQEAHMIREHDFDKEIILIGGSTHNSIDLCDKIGLGYIKCNDQWGNCTVPMKKGDVVIYSILGVKWRGRYTGDVTKGGSAIFERLDKGGMQLFRESREQ
jgi:hypothetical protein